MKNMLPLDNPPYEKEEEAVLEDAPMISDDLEIIEVLPSDLMEELADDDEERNDDDGEIEIEEEEEEEEERDDAMMVFSGHDGPVFCGAMLAKLAVTGAGDDKACVWDTESGEPLFDTGDVHKDSVCHCTFNPAGTLVATGDMAGTVAIWQLPAGEKMACFELGSDLTWLSWHPQRLGLMAGTDSGIGWWLGAKSGNMAPNFPGHGAPITCGEMFENGTKAVLGYEDGILKIWDLKSMAPIFTLGGEQGEGAAVLNLCVSGDSKLLAVGYKEDGAAKLYSTKTGKVIATWSAADIEAQDPETLSVESISFNSSNQLVAVGRLLGLIRLYDVSTKNVRISISLPSFLVKTVWDGPLLYSATTEGVIYVHDSRSGDLLGELHGHRDGPVLDLAISSDGEKVLATGEDHTSRVFAAIKS